MPQEAVGPADIPVTAAPAVVALDLTLRLWVWAETARAVEVVAALVIIPVYMPTQLATAEVLAEVLVSMERALTVLEPHRRWLRVLRDPAAQARPMVEVPVVMAAIQVVVAL
jgi:hypothetical protein